MTYSFQPLSLGGPPARPAPIPAAAPRRTDWRVDAGTTVSGPTAPAQQRGRPAALRRSYLDADEVAMERAMARLSGDDRGKKAGLAYSQVNRERTQATLQAKAAEGLVPCDPLEQHEARRRAAAGYTSISERAVRVPRVGVRSRGPAPPPIAYVPHRRTGEDIRQENGGYEREALPSYVATRSREEMKDELALRNQFHGRTAEEVLSSAGPGASRPRAGRRAGKPAAGATDAGGQAGGQEASLRAQIADEVAERQEWLDKMRALGQSAPHEAAIRSQIAERLNDLKRLDELEKSEVQVAPL